MEAPSVLAGAIPGGQPTRPGIRASNVEGFCLIRAGSDAVAERIASGCPHLKYGGVIEVRRIEKLR